MSKLKEINGKYYQECEVVMSATDKKANIGTDNWYLPNKQILIINNLISNLYFLCDEEIKEGDWFMNRQYMIEEEGKEEYAIWRCGDITPNSDPKKIIATTDNYLQIHDKTPIGENVNGLWKCLPQPSKQFIQAYIKAYNENKLITKVLVEMEGILEDGNNPLIGEFIHKGKFKLKINSSNEITIKKIKDSYTREEYSKGLKYAIEQAIQYPELFITGVWSDDYKINNWLEENL